MKKIRKVGWGAAARRRGAWRRGAGGACARLHDALDLPLLVFDRASRLCHYNAAAAACFGLEPADLRQSCARLGLAARLPGLDGALARVLARGTPAQLQRELAGCVLRLSLSPLPDGQVLVCAVDLSEVARARAALSESERRLGALMDHTTVILALCDLQGDFVYANRRFLDFFGCDPTAVPGGRAAVLGDAELAAALWAGATQALAGQQPAHTEHLLPGPAGIRHLHVVHQVLRDGEGRPLALILEGEDITARRQAEEQLRITARVFEQAGEAIVVTTPEGVVQAANSAFTRITGYSLQEALGRRVGELLKSGRHSSDFYAALWQALHDGGRWQGEIWNRRKNGEIYPEWLTIKRVDDAAGRIEHYVAVFSDLSDVKSAQRKADYLAAHDVLTGLPNRSLFQDRLRHALAQARRRNGRVALLFIDLDNFKDINDTLGHDVGDELLQQVAERLQQAMRDVDTVARLGGDEFTAILSDCGAEGGNIVAGRIIEQLGAAFHIQQRQLFVSASIGVAFYPEDGTDSSTLAKAADTAMYRAKELGRNRVEFFVPDLQARLVKRATLETALRGALERHQLRLVFQPKFALPGGHMLLGAEALLRWHDPQLGPVPPGEFIPVCEASGLILDVTREVQRLLIEHLAGWRRLGLPVPPIAFNCSPRSMREPDMADALILRLEQAGVPADLVQVEITEGALLESSPAVMHNLNRLHGAGIAISVDDFGTGYSSLHYLKRLPLSELKVDKSFVDGLGADRDDEAIAQAVLALARALDLKSVAEGVESARQMAWLEAHGCDTVQGYYLSRPLEAVDFEDLLARTGRSR